MQYQQLIHEYLSGTLSEPEQKQLFDGIATNSEWRSELNLQLEMQSAAAQDLKHITVPAETTASIFSALGYAIPGATSSQHAAGHRAMPKLKLAGLISSGFLLVGIVLYLGMQRSNLTAVKPATHYQHAAPTLTAAPVSAKDEAATTITRAIDPQQSFTTSPIRGGAVANAKPQAIVSVATEALPVDLPNEPIKFYIDLGKFASVDYLTQSKIIGVAEAGKIYCSTDAGKTWVLQTSHTSSDLFGVNFTDATHGIVVGAGGTILLTDNSGSDWRSVKSPVTVNLITVRYASRDTAYACGASGTIVRSIDGGASWSKQPTASENAHASTANLFKIQFQTPSAGEIRGEHGVTFRTTNAGEQWIAE